MCPYQILLLSLLSSLFPFLRGICSKYGFSGSRCSRYFPNDATGYKLSSLFSGINPVLLLLKFFGKFFFYYWYIISLLFGIKLNLEIINFHVFNILTSSSTEGKLDIKVYFPLLRLLIIFRIYVYTLLLCLKIRKHF